MNQQCEHCHDLERRLKLLRSAHIRLLAEMTAAAGVAITGKTQPAPVPTGRSQPVTQEVIADLLRREAAGIKAYGRSLETHNGRDALRDAYEECLDQAQYLKQALMERGEGAQGG